MQPLFRPFSPVYPAHHGHRHLRAHGHRGFAGFGGRHGFAGSPARAGFDGLGRGRKLGSADLQLLLLALLADRPSHGYELIRALDERSHGYYSPSPGMVYPALTHLEEIGHASVETEGARKRYQVTDAGRSHLAAQRAAVDALLGQLAMIGERMAQMRRAMHDGAAPTHADAEPLRRGPHRGPDLGREIDAARRSLRSALSEKAGASPAEQQRIAAILERAAVEISIPARSEDR